MTYADHAFYTDVYLGVLIPKGDFPRLALRATEQVDYLTLGRAQKYYIDNNENASIRNATCAIAEVLYSAEQGSSLTDDGAGNIRSETVGQHRVEYATMDTATASGQQAISTAIKSAANKYLLATGLLFRGVIV